MEPQAYRDMARLQSVHWWYRARRRIIASRLSRLALPASSRILEIGAGPGGNLDMLSRFGRVHAVETDAYARDYAQSAFPALPIEAGRLPDGLPFENLRFDLITMFDVLEHIEDDTAALTAVKDRVQPNGALVVTVPAYQWMWSTHDTHLHHFRRYTARRLSSALTASGWALDYISYFNTLLFPVAVAARLFDRLAQRGAVTGAESPPPAVNAVLHGVFSSEEHLLRLTRLPFGLSLICVARPGPA